MTTDAQTQAEAQIQGIVNLYNAYRDEDDAIEIIAEHYGIDADEVDEDMILQIVHEDALSVEVRSGWQNPSAPDWQNPDGSLTPAEYRIVLCTGGPHVELRGEIDRYHEPATARIYAQGWFEGKSQAPTSAREHEALLWYANNFYFG